MKPGDTLMHRITKGRVKLLAVNKRNARVQFLDSGRGAAKGSVPLAILASDFRMKGKP